MIWLGLYLAAGAIAGWVYLSMGSRRTSVGALDRCLLMLPVGLLLVSIATFVAMWPLGVRLSRTSVLICAVVTGVLGLFAVRLGVPAVLRWGKGWRLERRHLLVVAAAGAAVVAFFAWILWLILTRPVLGHDFYLYHWHFTRILVETGRLPLNVSPSYFEYQYASPPLNFLLYAHLSLLLGGLSQVGPRLLPLCGAAAMVLLATRMARVHLRLSVAASVCAAAFALFSGYYEMSLSQENTDTISAFFAMAAAYWLLRRDLGTGSRVLGGGVLLAGAYWGRYDGLMAFIVLPAVVGFGAWFERRRGHAWSPEMIVAGGAALVAVVFIAPHVVRNLVLFGNPLYPAFAGVVGGHLIDGWTIQETLKYSSAVPFYDLPAGWWFEPLHALRETAPSLAILTAGAIPSIARLRRGDVQAAQLLTACALWIAFSLVFMRIPDDGDRERHLIVVAAWAAPLAGLVIEELIRLSWRAAWSVMTMGTAVAWSVVVSHDVASHGMTISLVAAFALVLAVSAWGRFRQVAGIVRVDLMLVFLMPFCLLASSTALLPIPSVYVVRQGLLQFPEAALMAGWRPADRYLGFEDRREMLAGEPLPGDHPSLEAFYTRRLDGEEGVRALKQLGVRYIYWTSPASQAHPIQWGLMFESPLYAELDDPRLFSRLYAYSDRHTTVAIYELR